MKGKTCPRRPRSGPRRAGRASVLAGYFCCVLLEPDAPPFDPDDEPEPLVAPEEGEEPDPPAVPPALPLGEAEEPEDELELGLEGVAPEDDELDDGLDDPPELMPLELELDGDFFVVSLDDEPEAEPDAPVEPEVAPEPAPRLESPALSQPYRPPTATARGISTKADFLSIDKLL